MESARFDRLARLLGATTSRRAGIGLAVAALTGAAIAEPASAAATCRRGRQTCQRNTQCCSGTCQTGRGFSTRERNRCTCEGGLEVCANACVDTDTDARHCGACGNRCGAGDRCIDGECRIHQQCFSADGGLCYMTPDGREHRGDGFLLAVDPYDTPCSTDAECVAAYVGCDFPGVHCTCVRAIDSGSGYEDLSDAGTGTCMPLLDNGDGEITCRRITDTVTCLYGDAEQEIAACTETIESQGLCIDGACAGVGACDDDGVTCSCIVAVQVGTPGQFWIYTNFFIQAPTCASYQAPIDGVCTPPA